MQELAKKIVDSCDFMKMVSLRAHPLPGEYVIEAKDGGPARDNTPMAKITVQHADGSRLVELV